MKEPMKLGFLMAKTLDVRKRKWGLSPVQTQK